MKYHYIRNLPHFQPGGYVFFITSRLACTIPHQIFKKNKYKYNDSIKYISEMNDVKKKAALYHQIQQDEFLRYEKILHSAKYGNVWLKDPAIALILSNALHFHDKNRYDLFAFTIMPNHFHVILKPIEIKSEKKNTSIEKDYFSLENIMRSIKGFSGKEANKYLGKKGAFWQHENYDHVIRNNDELLRTINYILSNPVKAGLCKTVNDWEWNYINPELL